MELVENKILFNSIPAFSGEKGFSVVYLNGEFHLFFSLSSAFKSIVLHFVSEDCYEWQEKDVALVYKGYVDSVTACVKNGKIYLYYAVKNILLRTNIRLAVSKDGEFFEPYPNALLKNTLLSEIKTFYSSGKRWMIGSEQKGIVPAYVSEDGTEWIKSDLTVLANDGEIMDYLGSPSPFTACGKTFVAYSMFGGHVVEADINLSEGKITLGKKVLETYSDNFRSVMLREGTPLIFIGYESTLTPIEVFENEGVGFRLYRDMLKSAKLRVDNGVEENAKMPTAIVREKGVLHLFELPVESGVALDFGGTLIEIDENKTFVIDGAIEDCDLKEYDFGEEGLLEVAILDMGNLIIVEAMNRVHAVITGASQTASIKVGEKDYLYTSYKL